jgi:hypothetical protein
MPEDRPRLTLEKARSLCEHFTPVKNPSTGKSRCISLSEDGEICQHPQHFLCELVTWARYFERNEKQNEQKALSPSRVNCLDSCSRKYAFRYLFKIPSQSPDPMYFRTGDAFTVARAKLDLGEQVDLHRIRKDISAFDAAKLRAALRFYDQERPYEAGTRVCELEAHFEHRDQWFFGYLDAMTIDAPHAIEEWKYAAGKYDTLRVARQASVYLKAFPQADRFNLWVFVKSALRPKKNESMSEFEERVLDDFVKKGRGKVYDRTTILRSDLDVDGVLNDMVKRFALLPVYEDAGYPPSYQSCSDCMEYRDLCSKRVGASTEAILEEHLKSEEWNKSIVSDLSAQ